MHKNLKIYTGTGVYDYTGHVAQAAYRLHCRINSSTPGC